MKKFFATLYVLAVCTGLVFTFAFTSCDRSRNDNRSESNALYAYNFSEKLDSASDIVYVCSRSSASCYHLDPDCPALGNCKNGSISISINEAIAREKRVCQRCLKKHSKQHY